MLFTSMFEQTPKRKLYNESPGAHHQIRDYEHLLKVLNYTIDRAPHCSDVSHRIGYVGLPINGMLDRPRWPAFLAHCITLHTPTETRRSIQSSYQIPALVERLVYNSSAAVLRPPIFPTAKISCNPGKRIQVMEEASERSHAYQEGACDQH